MDFELDGRQFRAATLSAMQQFQLSRKLAPLLPALAPLFLKAADLKGALNDNVLDLMQLAEPFTEALADMKDADAEQIVTMTLSSVKTETAPGTWMPLWTGGVASIIELNEFAKLLPIILRVIQFNLGGFISGFLMSREEPSVKSSGGASPVRKTG
jgi:hypothetical protein